MDLQWACEQLPFQPTQGLISIDGPKDVVTTLHLAAKRLEFQPHTSPLYGLLAC